MRDYTVVRAYGAGDEIFSIARVGPKLAIRPAIPEPARVDRLVFFGGSGVIRLVAPLLPGTLDLEGKDGGFRLDGAIRALVLGGNTQFISLETFLRLGTDGTPELGRFAIREWDAAPAPIGIDDVAQRSFTSPTLNRAPHFSEALGLKVAVQVPGLRAKLRFAPGPLFQMDLPVTSQAQKLTPFGLSFSPADLPDNRAELHIRLARVKKELANDPKAWPSSHWVAELAVPGTAATRRWNDDVVAVYVKALHTVQDGRPVSLIPRLPNAAATLRWCAKLSFVDQVLEKSIRKDQFVVRDPGADLSGEAVTVIGRTLEPKQNLEKVELEFPGFRTIGEKREPLKLTCAVETHDPTDHETDLEQHNEGFYFVIAHQATAAEQVVRVGALDLVFRSHDHLNLAGEARVSFRKVGGVEVPRVERLMILAGGVAIRPGNQDPIPGEEFNESSLAFAEPKYDASFRRATPLVIDLNQKQATVPLLLRVEESAIERESQTITMSLSSDRHAPQDVDAIVIDSDPFFVARVQVDSSKTAAETALTTEIGNWSNRSNDLGWEMSSAASGFDLVLPPQGIGESTEKREGDFFDDQGKIAPADFRFSPNARFRLRSSFFRQRFVEVPWNLRRILGYPGQRAAGAGVETLDFELLYGLSAHVENKHLRLAEIAARLGHLPGRQARILPWDASNPQKAVYAAYRARWQDQYPSLLSRLAILEPYQADREESLTLNDAEGLSYEFRKEADLADPLRRNPSPAADFFRPNGLRGGWSWGFESANILEAVLRTPRSSSALLARPFFSALGGWGYQKASFDRNLSTIYSDTTMGRTFSISIERIGRISVLWNRAKHVIVYERTVMPTRQFAGEQDLLLGIPVLRKVREYVEILQAERSYPEFGEAPIVRGFVHGSKFPEGSLRINVNSSWGEDVGRIGWKVPLWKRDIDPVVYPRPAITLAVAGDHPEKIIPLTLSEPDKLCFFTNTEASQPPDSDLWPAVQEIDYPVFTDFKVPAADFDVGTPKEHKGNASNRVMPGNGGFTFALDATPHATDVVHARTDEPIGAILRNVTMARGPLLEQAGAKTVTVVRDVLSEGVRTALAHGADVAMVSQVAATELRKVKEELAALVSVVPGTDAMCARLTEMVQLELERALTATGSVVPIVEQLRSVLAALRTNTDAQIRRVRAEGGALDAKARKRLDDARAVLRRDAVVALRSVQGAVGHAASAVRFANDTVQTMRTSFSERVAAISTAIGLAATWTADLRREVRKHAQSALDQLLRTEQALDEASRSLTGPIPDCLRLLARALNAAGRTFAQRALIATDSEVTVLPQKLRGELEALGARTLLEFDNISGQLAGLEKQIDTQFGMTPLESAVEKLSSDLEKLIAESADWQPMLDSVRERYELLFTQADSLIEMQIERLRTMVSQRAKLLCDSLPDPLELRTAILESLDNIDKQIDEVLGGITPAAEDVARVIDRLANQAARGITDLASAAGKAVAPIATSADRVFRLVRAFGDVPRVPGLGFDASQIAYHFIDFESPDKLLPHVALSPVIAKANQMLGDAAKTLSPLDTAIPSVRLLERIIPESLQNFDLAKIFPNFAGLKLEGLFSNVRMPRVANDNIRVTHGFDQQAMRGWVQVDADVPFEQALTVLSIVGITLTLIGGRFRAISRIDASAGQPPQQTFSGEIHGEWRLHVGGFDLVSFVDTRLRFDDRGNIRFDISPDRVKLQAVLNFVSDLMAGFGYADSGFSIKVMPSGIQSTLDLPLPDISGGAFGLSNLRLGSQFSLHFLPEFAIATRFFVAGKKAPFTITVFVLGGAGWVDASVHYIPSTREFRTNVSVGITAAASLAIAIGPIKGGVYAYFGITVEYESRTGGTNDLRIGLLLLFRGEVTLLGFLSVSLCLALEAQYSPGGGLVGRGHVSYSIKICWCVTINVSADVSYTFGGGGSTRRLDARREIPTFERAAIEYVEMFA